MTTAAQELAKQAGKGYAKYIQQLDKKITNNEDLFKVNNKTRSKRKWKTKKKIKKWIT